MRNIITPEALLVYPQILSLKTLTQRVFVGRFGNLCCYCVESITPETLRVYSQILSLKIRRDVFSSVASAIFETFTVRVLQRVFFLSFCKTLVLAYVRADFLRQHFVQFNMRNIITPEALLVYPQTLSLKTRRDVYSSVAAAIF